MSFNYIGCKKTLIPFLDTIISKNIEKDKDIIMLDGFAGTGIVGSSFNQKYPNVKIVANDLEYYSYIINYSLLCVNFTEKLKIIITKINSELEKDFITNKNYELVSKNYTLLGEDKRMFWTELNGRACDYTRYLIDQMLNNNEIDKNEHIFLNASILCSMDKIANTASVYGAFLKKFKSSAIEKFILIPIHKFENLKLSNKVYNCDINSKIILDNKYDIVYLDPPYNQRQYSANYHPLNYIAKYDKTIDIYGKTGLIKNSNKSKYSQKLVALESLTHLITNLNSTHIYLSYNNEGIIDFNDIKNLLLSQGKVILYKKLYKKFKSNKTQNNENVYEYLFHLNKKIKGKFEEITID
jgi:adenine-specific DNA-methyltransferase